MTLEAFFEKFDLFADAPDAVAKMRELVLELAVQGKLTQQLGSDDSVEKLLQKIHAEKVSLVNEGLLKKADRVEPLPDNLQLPSQWRHAPLAALCVSVTDGDHLPPPKAETGVPFLVISDVRWGGIDFTGCRRVSDEYFAKLDWIRKPQERDILYTLVGSFGIPVVVRDSQPFCIQRHIGILRPSKHIELQYLAYALESKMVFRQAALVATGIAQKTVPLAGLRKIVIPLPPLAEQKRIVAKVDELLALCDRLEAQQQERETRHTVLARASLARFADAPTPANLEYLFHSSFIIPPSSLRRSILTLAVQGKLVPQDPNDEEPEAALLELHRARIRQAKAGKLRAAKVPANAFLEEPLPFIPDSWRTVSFDHLAVAHNNALKAGPFGSALKKEFYVEKGYKIYGQEQVIAGDPFIGDYYIDEKKFAELESCAVSPGDILISLVGTIGKLLVLSDGIEPGIINPRVIKLGLDPTLVYPMFIKVLIGSPYAVDFFEENSHGGTMNILNLSILRALPVPLPPLAEQRRIVAKVEQLMALVDALETQLAASRATAANLLSALVAELTQPL